MLQKKKKRFRQIWTTSKRQGTLIPSVQSSFAKPVECGRVVISWPD